MKRIFALLAMVAFVSASFAQTADEIIDKHLVAMGGKQKLASIKTIVMEGGLKVQGADVALKVTGVHNKGSRQDISVAGMSGYEITTATDGWNYFPFQGQTKAEPKTADEVKQGVDDLDLQGNLLDYKAKGHTVEYLGKEDVEGTECYKVKLVRKNGGDQTIYFDPTSYLVVRQVSKRKANGQEFDIIVDFSDYRDVDGIKFPFSLTTQMGAVRFSKIALNVPVEDSVFKPAN